MGIKLGSAACHAVATVAVAVAVNPAKPASKWLNVIPMCVFARISRSPRVAILPSPSRPAWFAPDFAASSRCCTAVCEAYWRRGSMESKLAV